MMKTISRAAAAALLCDSAAAAAAPGRLTDSQIVGIVESTDEAAWQAAARAAEPLGASDPDVLAFANLVIVDRLEEMRKLRAVGIAASDSADRARLVREEKANDARLKSLKGPALDRAFIAAAADGLSAALDDQINRLEAAAASPDLSTHLRERRYLLELHRARALALKDRLR